MILGNLYKYKVNKYWATFSKPVLKCFLFFCIVLFHKAANHMSMPSKLNKTKVITMNQSKAFWVFAYCQLICEEGQYSQRKWTICKETSWLWSLFFRLSSDLACFSWYHGNSNVVQSYQIYVIRLCCSSLWYDWWWYWCCHCFILLVISVVYINYYMYF